MQVGQEVVYFFLKKVLNYLQTNRLLNFEKKSTIIFGKVKQIVNCLQTVVLPNHTIWDSIVIIVVLDLLYKEFQPIITPLLYAKNKKLEEI